MSVRKVPKKNYYILSLMLIGVVIITFAIVNITNAVKNNNINSGYINKYVSQLSYEELDTYLLEPASNTFVYVTYTGDNSIYKMEKSLKKTINNYDLENSFIYIDLSEKKDDINFMNNFYKKIEGIENISKLPVLLYYKSGKLTDVIDSENKIFNVSDFQKLLDNYEITS